MQALTVANGARKKEERERPSAGARIRRLGISERKGRAKRLHAAQKGGSSDPTKFQHSYSHVGGGGGARRRGVPPLGRREQDAPEAHAARARREGAWAPLATAGVARRPLLEKENQGGVGQGGGHKGKYSSQKERHFVQVIAVLEESRCGMMMRGAGRERMGR